MKQKLLLVLLFHVFYFTHANEKILIPNTQFNIDFKKALIVSNLSVDFINSNWTGEKTLISLDNDLEFSFQSPFDILKIGIPYNVINSIDSKVYVLYFTELPLITITTNELIVDSPSVLAKFKLTDSKTGSIVSNIGIQYRGAYSQSLPKKSFEINFWDDEKGDISKDISLLGMHTDDGWNLQAMYNEALRFHSKTNNDLWKLIHKPSYLNSEPEAVSGIEMKYCELFLNGEYRGVYCIGEKVNRKLLKLKKYNGQIRGELYKGDQWGGSTTFDYLSAFSNENLFWGGFEYKYPKEITNWENLYNFSDFVINNSDSKFYDNYKSKFEINNAVDYFIFLNLLRALDNRGKNAYIAKYNSDSPYFYVPWDLDGTFGTIWNGQHDNVTNDLLSNGLYDRLLKDCSDNGFREKLKFRWKELRDSLITHDNLMGMFTSNYTFLKKNGIYERENIAWMDYSANDNEIDYISGWLTERLKYLDIKFSENCATLSVDDFESISEVMIFPNPTMDVINLKSNNFGCDALIYDSSGKLLFIKNFEGSQTQISMKNFVEGIYYLKLVTSENKIIVKKIIKK